MPNVPHYLDLATGFIPQRKINLIDRLAPAYGYFPFPLSLGSAWDNTRRDASPSFEQNTLDDPVPGLVISDMKTGAIRQVRAQWMHDLYNEYSEQLTNGRGLSFIHVTEPHPNFSARFYAPHRIIFGTVIVQVLLGIFTIVFSKSPREGGLILGGIVIQFLRSLHRHRFTPFLKPRDVPSPRYYALHTGMTTRHLLVFAHDPPIQHGLRTFYSLEDAATPLKRQTKRYSIEKASFVLLTVLAYIHSVVIVITPAHSFQFSLCLLLGTISLESTTFFFNCLPLTSRPYDPLDSSTLRENALLDTLTAACQFAGVISPAFIESMLPDPESNHNDYFWIKSTMAPEHPPQTKHSRHPHAQEILAAASLRWSHLKNFRR